MLSVRYGAFGLLIDTLQLSCYQYAILLVYTAQYSLNTMLSAPYNTLGNITGVSTANIMLSVRCKPDKPKKRPSRQGLTLYWLLPWEGDRV